MSLRDLLSVARDAALECVERRKPVAWVEADGSAVLWPRVFLALPMRTTTDWIVVTSSDHTMWGADAIVEDVARAATVCEANAMLLRKAIRYVCPRAHVPPSVGEAERNLLEAVEALRVAREEHNAALVLPTMSVQDHALAIAGASQMWRAAEEERANALFDLTVALLADAERALEGQ